MAGVAISEESRRYLEELRRKVPSEKIPSMRDLVGSILTFIKEREDEYISRYKELKPE